MSYQQVKFFFANTMLVYLRYTSDIGQPSV